jgi:WD40 repeat protein
MGTVGYMSPEQVRGKTIDHRTDIFAFGAILYEMLTGKRAFQRSTSAETMTAILNDDPPGVSQVAQSTPPGLQRVVHRCLEKSPEERFQSAADLAFALEASSDSGSASVAVIDQPSRSRWLWAGAAAVVVALVALGIAWWRTPPVVPVVESVTQLTDDSEPKPGNIGIYTDGSRIYFNEGPVGSRRIAETSVNGGPIALVDAKLDSPQILGLAADGSGMLAATGSSEDFARPLWSIPLPAGEPRRIRDIEATGAANFLDGRIVFTNGKGVFVADRDGANQRQLASLTGVLADMPSVSPDGQTISITMAQPDADLPSLVEVAANGTGVRTAYPAVTGGGVWSSDGRYLLFPDSSSDIWALPVKTGLLHRSGQPTRLTTGPLLYTAVCPSRDGKRLFALATRHRGELVRYDSKSHQFLPFLSGISAVEPTFSRDGKWVAYASYPDGILWRSRSDGSDKLQLTYPPMKVDRPRISPDGMKVAFSVDGRTFEVEMSGALPLQIAAKGDPIWIPVWSPDGNLLVVASAKEGAAFGDRNSLGLRIVDLRTGKTSVVPCPESMVGSWWVNQNTLVAATQDFRKFMTFDLKTQKWTELTAGALTAWAVSPDGQYLYYSTGGAEPKAWRLRFADHKIEMITSLIDPSGMGKMGWVQAIDVAPDGSAIFTRETGTQEVYALNVRWP